MGIHSGPCLGIKSKVRYRVNAAFGRGIMRQHDKKKEVLKYMKVQKTVEKSTDSWPAHGAAVKAQTLDSLRAFIHNGVRVIFGPHHFYLDKLDAIRTSTTR